MPSTMMEEGPRRQRTPGQPTGWKYPGVQSTLLRSPGLTPQSQRTTPRTWLGKPSRRALTTPRRESVGASPALRSERAEELLRTHRGPLRALFGCLEARCRGVHRRPYPTTPQQKHQKHQSLFSGDHQNFSEASSWSETHHGATTGSAEAPGATTGATTLSCFWEQEVGLVKSWREDWAAPLGWTTLKTRRVPKTELVEVLAAWGETASFSDNRRRARRAVASEPEEVDFAGVERSLVAWAGGEAALLAALSEVADACCKCLKMSCLSKLDLRAPWWLLGRGEASATGLAGPDRDEVQRAVQRCFVDLRVDTVQGFWSVVDFYALCRDAGLFGEALSPAALLAAYEEASLFSGERDDESPAEKWDDPRGVFGRAVEKLAALWWRGEGGEQLGGGAHAGGGSPASPLARVVGAGNGSPLNSSGASRARRGKRGDGKRFDDPTACLVMEKLVPLLACRAKRPSSEETALPRLQVGAECLQVVREHDMALRCLFVAYCDPDEGRVPPLAVLHFARDFRLLAADRFAPSAVVDAARAARQPNHVDSDDVKGLRWPEFVETLLRLADARRLPGHSMAQATTALLALMDPDGRVFFLGGEDDNTTHNIHNTPNNRTAGCAAGAASSDADAAAARGTPPSDKKERIATRPAPAVVVDARPPPNLPQQPSNGLAAESASPTKLREPDPGLHEGPLAVVARQTASPRSVTRRPPTVARRDETARSLDEAAAATRALAEAEPDPDLDAIADAVVACGLAGRPPRGLSRDDVESCFDGGAATADTATQVDLLFDDSETWPPPPTKTAVDIWADAPEPTSPPDRVPSFDDDVFASTLAVGGGVPRPLPPPPPSSTPGARRRRAAASIQRVARGFSLRRRLALLRDLLLEPPLEEKAHFQPSVAPTGRQTGADRVTGQPLSSSSSPPPPQRTAEPDSEVARSSRDDAEPAETSAPDAAATAGSPQPEKETPQPTPPSAAAQENKEDAEEVPQPDDERAVIHAFALAALLGDGSPKRVARARALVETLKDLPATLGETRGPPRQASDLPDLQIASPRTAGPTLDELEAQLRDALARVALEEKWRVSDEGTKQARAEAAALSARVEKHPGYAARLAAEAAQWDARELPANKAALAALRELIPRDVARSDKVMVARNLAAAVGVEATDARIDPLVERVWSQKILWLVHMDHAAIARIHVADLRARYTFADLDPVELRAVFACLPDAFENDEYGFKWAWRDGLRAKLVEVLASIEEGRKKPKRSLEDAQQAARGSANNGDDDGSVRRVLSCSAIDVASPGFESRRPTSAADAGRHALSAGKAGAYHHVNKRGVRVGHAAYDVLDQAAAQQAEQKKARDGAGNSGGAKSGSPDSGKADLKLEIASPDPPGTIGPLVWRECWDDNYKRVYYFNDDTGESIWEPPDEPYAPYDPNRDDDAASTAPSEAPSSSDLRPRSRRPSSGGRPVSHSMSSGRGSFDADLARGQHLDAILEKKTLSRSSGLSDEADRPSFLISPLSDEDETGLPVT